MSRKRIEGNVALVTGANRGIGRAITEALLERGAAKVCAGARKPEALADLVESYGDRVVPIPARCYRCRSSERRALIRHASDDHTRITSDRSE